MSPGAACEKTIIDCVSSDRRPTERIYLKGFSGGDYVNGEWVAADDEAIFQRMEENTLHWDGSFVSVVHDYQAHAWPEIYLANYGWVPVEVTPSSYEAAETAYLGLDMEALQDSLESVQWDRSALTQQTVEEPEEREELNGPRLSCQRARRSGGSGRIWCCSSWHMAFWNEAAAHGRWEA